MSSSTRRGMRSQRCETLSREGIVAAAIEWEGARMSGPLLLAIDQGTSSTKCLVVDDRGQVVSRGQAPVSLSTPQAGWVDQDADEIWASVRRAVGEALDAETAKRVVSVGLSTQRESCVVWDRRSGNALTPVLSWQDQRTESVCQTL